MLNNSCVLDRLLDLLDQSLRTCFGPPQMNRPSPADGIGDVVLSPADKRVSASLMRVNHAGEIAAQALYAGQAVMARTVATRNHLRRAAAEEQDHLAWCAARLTELDGRPSLLTPFWFAGGAAIGMAAAAIGDSTSFGLLEETERQVEAHLGDHLRRLPAGDSRSRAVLTQMALDEARHGEQAQAAGAADLPAPVPTLMRLGGGIVRNIALIL